MMSEKTVYGTVAPSPVPSIVRTKPRSRFLEHVLRLGLIVAVVWVSLPMILPSDAHRGDEAEPAAPWSWQDVSSVDAPMGIMEFLYMMY